MLTSIGDSNLFMACSHIGHDCRVGNSNIVANSVAVSGHVEIGSHVTIGGLVGIHQFVRLGDYGLLGAGAMVTKDLPPYCTAQGDRCFLIGVNTVRLERCGFSAQEITDIKRLYKTVFMGAGAFKERLVQATQEFGDSPKAKAFLDFIASSERGVMTARARVSETAGTDN